jgi:hypothetical protein
MDAFVDLFAQLDPVDSLSLSRYPRWTPKPGRQAEAERLAATVARLAGPAAEALNLSGSLFNYKPPGTWQTQPANPALLWSTMLTDDAMLDPQLMEVACAQGLGLLENRRDEQAAREKGVVGAIAWFLTLAPRVREAAGLPRHTARGNLVTGAVALVQTILVAVVGGALAAGLAHAFGWA